MVLLLELLVGELVFLVTGTRDVLGLLFHQVVGEFLWADLGVFTQAKI